VQVLHPVEYAKVVKRIGNEMDLTQVELEDLLPAASIMVTTVTATTTAGRPLSGEVLAKVEQGCDMALQLDDDKQQVRRR
jgi:U4/U6 small nuclear ribonucleoprotein PRP31